MNIEKQVRKELRRVAFYRVLTAIIVFPGSIIYGLSQLLVRVAKLFDNLADSTFYFEADAARRYRNLTGIDLGFAASGDLTRYAGTNPRSLALAEKDEFGGDGEDDE